MTEIKQHGGETPAGGAAVMAWAISPQDPVAPSDRLSSLHVGVTWEEGVDFSEKENIMQQWFFLKKARCFEECVLFLTRQHAPPWLRSASRHRPTG